MPVYEFKCGDGECDARVQALRAVGDTTPPVCPECGGATSRRFSMFSSNMGMPDHYNAATGSYVSSERQLKDRFKAISEERTLATGIEHDFKPIDLRDKEAMGVTDEGLEETYRRAHNEGRANTVKWL